MPKSSQKLDEMKGVINEIYDTNVYVSLFRNDEEFCVGISRTVFEAGKVVVREGEGFFFWVEKCPNGIEKQVVQPLPSRKLSPRDLKDIDKKITELLR